MQLSNPLDKIEVIGVGLIQIFDGCEYWNVRERWQSNISVVRMKTQSKQSSLPQSKENSTITADKLEEPMAGKQICDLAPKV